MLKRTFAALSLLALAAAACWAFAFFYEFGQTRFFTVDEWQMGHATWLVRQGLRPYVDFYEHHFPLGYVMHAVLLDDDASMVANALLLRRIVFGYLVGVGVVVAGSRWVVSRNPYEAILSSFVPFAVGFTLMSVIEYRIDNLAAFYFLACYALLEANRRLRSRILASVAGLLLGVAGLITQKMLAVAGATLAVLLAADAWRRRRHPEALPFVVHPVAFLLPGALLGSAALVTGAFLGFLPQLFQITIVEAIPHARLDRVVPLWQYASPFLSATAPTSLALALGLLGWLAIGARREPMWLVPLGLAGLLGIVIRAGYPYNYVLLLLLAALLAVRGFSLVVGALAARLPERSRAALPLLYLLPLAVLPQQMHFVERASDNPSQLAILAKIDRFSEPQDAVIDGAGGAPFRPHGSYYWMHGAAHRQFSRDLFRDRLPADYRNSRAIFWIDDFRQRKLPRTVRRYLTEHYVRVDGELYALGFATPATGAHPARRNVELVRSGTYHLIPASRLPTGWQVEEAGRCRLVIDGRIPGDRVYLTEGRHEIAVLPDSSSCVVAIVPREAFRPWGLRYTRLFEYSVEPDWKRIAGYSPPPARRQRPAADARSPAS